MTIEKKHFFPPAAILLICAVLLTFGLIKRKIYGQESTSSTTAEMPLTKRPLIEESKTLVKKTGAVFPAGLQAAAYENTKLKNSLGWTFGAKPQRGWYIYVPLIQQTIGTEAEAETPEFARTVFDWQQKSGLSPSGKIDNETLLKMVEWWQSRRLNSSRYPSGEELLNAPISDFYDPTRDAALLQVERETYNAYKKMLAAAAKDLKLKTTKTGELAPDEKYLRIISSFRSREYQEQLRRASPHSGRAGLAVNSPHFTGRALDIYVGGEATITKDPNRAAQVNTPAYKWLVKNAARFGFYPYYYEPWHWEYVPHREYLVR
ncbi:MAG: D-alanyl-D-alanine carboxypeptidase family protein [Acidobacteriota bacterium]|nr:D-alanyl-D-alanine carboxypeptidase family protein [Acidobacteriota bacterium]